MKYITKNDRGFFKQMLMAVLITVLTAQLSNAEVTIGRGYQHYIDTGLDLKAIVHIPLISGQFKVDKWQESGFTMMELLTYHYEQFLGDGVVRLPQAPDAIPYSNWIYDVNDDYVIKPEYLPFMKGVQWGDEQPIDAPALPAITSAIAALKLKYPHAIVFTNQSALYNEDSNGNNLNLSVTLLKNYMAATNPDILHFTEYPFRWQGTGYSGRDYYGGSPTYMYQDMEMYRIAGLAGCDGIGSTPIPVGMNVQAFYHKDNEATNDRFPTESEYRLQQFAAWAFGYRSTDCFLYIESEDCQGMFFEGRTQTPTENFYKYAELNRQSKNLSPTLVKLLTSDVRMKMGEHINSSTGLAVTNSVPSGISTWSSTADTYLKDVNATNLGTLNSSLRGDVVVGFLKPLAASLVETGHENDTYFMVVNGLTAATGDAAACKQTIRLDFNFGTSGITKLIRFSRETGNAEEVQLVSDGNGLYHLDLTLDGGTGDLFKYDTVTANTVSGAVTLSDYGSTHIAGTSVTFTLKQNNATVDTKTATLAADGSYSFTTEATGTVTIQAKAPHWLGKTQSVELSATTTANFTLKNGDVNNDNKINVLDYSVMKANYNKTGMTGHAADLNGDGNINVLDYTIMKKNYNVVGE